MTAPSAQNVVPLDLLARQPQASTAVKAMTKIARHVALGTRRVLPFLVRQRAKISPSDVLGRVKPEDRIMTGPGFAVRLEAVDGPAWALLVLDARIILLILEGCLGGAPSADAESPEIAGELSAAQRALLKGVSARLAEEVALGVAEETQIRLKVLDGVGLGASDVLDVADDALSVDLEISEIGSPARLRVFIGGGPLEAALREQEEGDEVAFDPRMVEAIQGAELAVVAELGRITLGLGQVLALRPGETLRLPTALDEPISIRVQGVSKFMGTPTISRGQVAIKVNGRLE